MGVKRLCISTRSLLVSRSSRAHYHKTLCLALIDCLISRDSFSYAQQVIQQIIMQCSSLPDAISAVDYVTNRGDAFCVGRTIFAFRVAIPGIETTKEDPLMLWLVLAGTPTWLNIKLAQEFNSMFKYLE
ncbi:hypothetical protein LOK49_LG01G00314 [Camellia lanceoleosa]|uniref:Uncharacterized protein n=1 Tax=Camellia lanceoleosa TaxID=1840588 RepID=A0ACC0J1U2_9ERIC|nr:hypothetical protein LOK49_LG01G00314 [Camellia lanceoleosa]